MFGYGLLVGLFLGAWLGALCMAMMFAAGNDDEMAGRK